MCSGEFSSAVGSAVTPYWALRKPNGFQVIHTHRKQSKTMICFSSYYTYPNQSREGLRAEGRAGGELQNGEQEAEEEYEGRGGPKHHVPHPGGWSERAALNSEQHQKS